MKRTTQTALALAAVLVAFALGAETANGRSKVLAIPKRGVVHLPLNTACWYTIRIDGEYDIDESKTASCGDRVFNVNRDEVQDYVGKDGNKIGKHTLVKLRWDGISLRLPPRTWADTEGGELLLTLKNGDTIGVPVALCPQLSESSYENYCEPAYNCAPSCCERRGLFRRR